MKGPAVEKIMGLLDHISISDVVIILLGIIALAKGIAPLREFIAQQEEKKAEDEAWKENIDIKLTKLSSSIAKIENIESGLKNVLKLRLVINMERAQRNGYKTTDEMRAITDIYESYKNLNGNGMVTALFNEYLSLPTKPKGDKYGNN